MEVDAAGQVAEGPGGAGTGAVEELLHVIAGGELELTYQLAVDRMLHHHVQHGAAVIHADLELPLHLLGGVADGHGVEFPRILPIQKIAPGRGGDGFAPRPKEGNVPHNDLSADSVLFGQRSGAHRAVFVPEPGQDRTSPLLGVHVSSPQFFCVQSV